MRNSRILELIWQGDLQLAKGSGVRQKRRVLSALLPLRVVFLTASRGVDRSFILSVDTEVLPEITLGDVLAEELSIDIPSGTLVVISDEETLSDGMLDDELSYDTGTLVAETLLAAIQTEVFPLEQETDALFVMASSYHDIVGASGFHHLGLVPAKFREGLAAGLSTLWSGARTARSDTSGLFSGPDFLRNPRLIQYLHQLDCNFSAPDRIPAGLMLFVDGPCAYGDWLERVHAAVVARLEAHTTRRWESRMS